MSTPNFEEDLEAIAVYEPSVIAEFFAEVTAEFEQLRLRIETARQSVLASSDWSEKLSDLVSEAARRIADRRRAGEEQARAILRESEEAARAILNDAAAAVGATSSDARTTVTASAFAAHGGEAETELVVDIRVDPGDTDDENETLRQREKQREAWWNACFDAVEPAT